MRTKKLLLIAFLLLSSLIINAQTYLFSAPEGYGAGATGGGNATPTVVTTAATLTAALKAAGNGVIIVKGTISMPYTSVLVTNKTLLGLPGARLVNLDQTATGSGILYIKPGSNNVIIRNLIFEGPGAYDEDGRDPLCFDGASKCWVDHCEFQDGMDGNLDHKGLTDNTTITWCKFHYLKAPRAGGSGGTNDHRFTNLVGSSDGDFPADKLYSITWQYCWWGPGCVERMVRARNAQLHMLNCYWNSPVAKKNIGLGDGSGGGGTKCYVENGVFESTGTIGDVSYGGSPDLKFVNCIGGGTNTATAPPAPTYTYSVLPVAQVKAAVTNPTCGAGATLIVTEAGGISTSCGTTPSLTLTSGAASQTIVAGSPAGTIVYTWGGNATGVTVTGLPAGLTGTSDAVAKTYTIAGNPTATGTYNITTTQASGTAATASGTITVVPLVAPTLVLTSGLASQSKLVGEAISTIVYTYGGGATDVTVTNIPDGITYVKNATAKTITITGTPTTAATTIYTLVTVGGLAPAVTLNGTFTITAPVVLPIPTGIVATPSATSVTLNWNQVAGATGYIVNFCDVPASGDLVLFDEKFTNQLATTGTTTTTPITFDETWTRGTGAITFTEANAITINGASRWIANGIDLTDPNTIIEFEAKYKTGYTPVTGDVSAVCVNDASATNSGFRFTAAAGGVINLTKSGGTGTPDILGATTLTAAYQTYKFKLNGYYVGTALSGNDWISIRTQTSTFVPITIRSMKVYVDGGGAGTPTCTEYVVAGGTNTTKTVTGLTNSTNYSYQVKATNAQPLEASPYSTAATVTTLSGAAPVNAILTLTSAGANIQAKNTNVAITNITYTYTGTIGSIAWTGTASSSTPPTGISVNTGTAGAITISGTPTAAGTFGYTVTINGIDGGTNATGTGTLTITAAATNASITLTSGAGTNTPTVTTSNTLPDISYSYIGTYSSIAWTGTANSTTAPTGIAVNSAVAGQVTITGTPTVAGTYGYTISINGISGGSNTTTTGTITVSNPVILATPTGLTATPNAAAVNFAWTPVAGATAYTLNFCTTGTGSSIRNQWDFAIGSWSINAATSDLNLAVDVNRFNYKPATTNAPLVFAAGGNIPDTDGLLFSQAGVDKLRLGYGTGVINLNGTGIAVTIPCEIGDTITVFGPAGNTSAVNRGYSAIGGTLVAANCINVDATGILTAAGTDGTWVYKATATSVKITTVAGGMNLKRITVTNPSGTPPVCTQYAIAGGATSSFAVSSLTPLTTYTYQLKATNGNVAEQSAYTASANVTTTAVSSATKDITSFTINGVAGTISGTNISVVLPAGTNLTSLTPVIVHNGASISPTGAQNFSAAKTYTVTASDASTQAYTVTVTKTVPTCTVCVPGSFSFTSTTGTASTSVTCNITASGLGADIVATVDAPFQIRLNGTDTWATSKTITQVAGAVNQTIEIRYNPTIAGTQTGNISFTSIDMVTKTIALSGSTTDPTITTLANKDQSVTVNTAIAPITYTLGGTATTATLSGSLPTGVVFNAATGTISGTPSVVGTFNYTITTDGSPAASFSGTINVTALANIAPVVTMTSPANGACITEGTPVVISANATDADGTVSQVEFFINGISVGLGVKTGSSYAIAGGAPPYGTYTVHAVATDNSIATTTAASISVKTSPTVTLTGATNGAVINCTTPNYILGYTLSSGTASSQAWSNSASTATATITAAGAYSVIVTMPNACTSTSNTINLTKDISAAAVTIAGAGEVNCTTTSRTLTASQTGTGYAWKKDAVAFGTSAISQNTTAAGSYIVTVTYANGCTAVSPAVTVTTNTTAPAVTIGGAGEVNCTTTSRTLTASQTGTGYAWKKDAVAFGTSAISQNTTAAGSYIVTVTYANGCTAVSPAVTVTTNTAAPAVTIGGAGEVNCTTTSRTLTASQTGTGYAWTKDGVAFGTSAISQNTTAAGSYIVTVTYANGCTAVSPAVNVTTNTAAPAVTIGGAGEVNCTTTSRTLTASQTGTGYAWTKDAVAFGSSAISQNTTAAGSYIVTVTYANGCTAVSPAVTVTTNTAAPAVTIAGAGELNCTTTSFSLTASQTGASYAWTKDGSAFGASAISQTATAAGLYAVTVSYANGCTSTAPAVSVTTNNAAPTVTLNGATNGAVINCTTTNYTLGYTFSSGTVTSQLWSNAASTPTINVTNAGAYNVTVLFSNGCSATSNTINITKDISAPAVTIGGAGEVNCTTTSRTLTASQTGATYVWTKDAVAFGTSTISQNTSAAGSYIVTVNYANGCSVTSPAVIVTTNTAAPAVTIGGAGEVNCTTTSRTLTASQTAATYAWTKDAVAFGTSAISQNTTAAGSYIVTVTYANGCTAVSPAVTVTTNTAAPAVTIGGAGEVNCTTTSRTLTASQTGTGYAWTKDAVVFGSSAISQNTTAAGSYAVTVTYANGCTATAPAVNVTTNTAAPAVTVSGAGEINCTNTALTLTPSQTGNSYIWYIDAAPYAISNTVSVSAAANYSVKVTYANGCSATSPEVSITENNEIPTVTLTGAVSGNIINCTTPSYTLGYTLSTGTESSRTWSNGASSNTITVSDAGNYKVTVSMANGCTAQSNTIVLTKDASIPTVTLTGAANGSEINCTNPSYNLAYTISGGVVSNQTWSTTATSPTINVTNAGNYFVTVNFDNGCSTTSNTINLTKDVSAPAVSITGAGELTCAVSSLSLSADQTGASYAWTKNTAPYGTSINPINVNAAGSYAVTVTYANGCTATASPVIVTINSTAPTITLTGAANGALIDCSNTSYTLGYSVSAGTVSSQTWSTLASTPSIIVAGAGTYSVNVVMDNGCTASSNSITINNSGSLQSTTILAPSGSALSCSTTSLTVSSSLSGSSYRWIKGGILQVGGISQSFTTTSPGEYILEVDYIGGCTAKDTIVITQDLAVPTVSLTGATDNAQINCTTPSYTLGFALSSGTETSRIWSTAASTTSINTTNAGRYYVRVTMPNGCSATSDTIDLTKDISYPVVTLSGATTGAVINCSTPSYTLAYSLSSGTESSRTWSTSGNTATINVTNAGTYNVVVTMPNGCSATSNSISLTKDIAVPTVTLYGASNGALLNSTNPSYTLGYSLSSGTASSQMWSNSISTPTNTVSTTGTYNVMVTMANGCSATSNSISLLEAVDVPTMSISGNLNQKVKIGSALESIILSWTGGEYSSIVVEGLPDSVEYIIIDNGTSGEIRIIGNPLESSAYTVKTIDQNGTEEILQGYIKVVGNKVYQDGNGNLRIDGNVHEYHVFTADGKLVAKELGNESHVYEKYNSTSGTYVIRILETDKKTVNSLKFIWQRR